MEMILNLIKPEGLCALEGCNTHVKTKRRKYCSRKCHEKAIGSQIPTCHNPACGKRTKRGRNLYCSWDCYKIDNNKHAHETCQRIGCEEKLISRKSSRKYCSPECYKLDYPNRPSKKVVRICQIPECGKQIKRRGNGRKYCSVECSVKSRKKLIPISCPTCDIEFSPKRQKQIFCSEKCRGGDKTLTIKKLGNLPRRFSRVTFPQLNISVKTPNKWVLTANLTWEQSNGPVPKGMNVWFIDSNTFNDMDISNLYLISHKEYLELSRKVTQSENESEMKCGNYEGREERKYKKEELYNPNDVDIF